MTDKAYIVINKQQEREVLEKLEREGLKWKGLSQEPTQWLPTRDFRYGPSFPYILFGDDVVSWCSISELKDKYEIVFDGRKEERMSNKLDRTLTIFTNNGQSFMFKHVTDFNYTTTGFEFSYTGKTTGFERHAVFNNTSVAGYALSD